MDPTWLRMFEAWFEAFKYNPTVRNWFWLIHDLGDYFELFLDSLHYQDGGKFGSYKKRRPGMQKKKKRDKKIEAIFSSFLPFSLHLQVQPFSINFLHAKSRNWGRFSNVQHILRWYFLFYLLFLFFLSWTKFLLLRVRVATLLIQYLVWLDSRFNFYSWGVFKSILNAFRLLATF